MPAHTTRILFVNTDGDERGAVASQLRREGYDVLAVGTCEAAVRSARQEPVDLLVTDLLLADGNGFALLRRVRDIRPVQGILVTGAPVGGNLVGPGRFTRRLIKPITFADLLATIEELLDPHRLTNRLTNIRNTVKMLSNQELLDLSRVLRRRTADLKEEMQVLQEMLGRHFRPRTHLALPPLYPPHPAQD